MLTQSDIKILRELAYKDLDAALNACVRATIEINKKRGCEIHPNAYEILEN